MFHGGTHTSLPALTMRRSFSVNRSCCWPVARRKFAAHPSRFITDQQLTVRVTYESRFRWSSENLCWSMIVEQISYDFNRSGTIVGHTGGHRRPCTISAANWKSPRFNVDLWCSFLITQSSIRGLGISIIPAVVACISPVRASPVLFTRVTSAGNEYNWKKNISLRDIIQYPLHPSSS